MAEQERLAGASRDALFHPPRSKQGQHSRLLQTVSSQVSNIPQRQRSQKLSAQPVSGSDHAHSKNYVSYV